MMHNISVKVTVKGSGLMRINTDDFSTLQKEIKENYISNIRIDGRPQFGGMVDVIVELLLDISFVDFFKIVRDGLLFDLVIRGKKSYVLKPLISAFAKIEKNSQSWDYSHTKLLFDGTEVVILGMDNMFTSRIGIVFNALSQHYQNLLSFDNEAPYEIIIPIHRTIDENRKESFYEYPMGGDLGDYSKYWGVSYKMGFERKVYDVKSKSMIEQSWQ